MKLSKKIIAAALSSVLVLGSAAAIATNEKLIVRNMNVTAANSGENTSYLRIHENGKLYKYNTQITSILYIGVNEWGEMTEANETYGEAGNANTLELVLLDNYSGDVKIIGINRDTITDVLTYTENGVESDTVSTQIAHAYTAGDNYTVSCENVVNAVSELLGGIPINYYIATNFSTIVTLNDTVSGVTVTVPNDELVAMYPELEEGAEVTLTEDNVFDFVVYADEEAEFENAGRMARGQAFSSSYINLMNDMVQNDPEGFWGLIEEIAPYMQTSVTKSKYLDLANLVSSLTYTPDNYINIEGEYFSNADGMDEFYPDEEALHNLVLDLFYIEK